MRIISKKKELITLIQSKILLKKKLHYRNLKIWNRSFYIPIDLLGFNVLVHNGRYFKKLSIKQSHIGKKFGEFIFTRKFTLKKDKKKKNNKK